MNDSKHVVVGIFVLVGAVILGGMIIWFKGIPLLVRGGYAVQGHLASSAGVNLGKVVHLDGVRAGEVVGVASSLPERPGVWLRMWIDAGVAIPKDARLVGQQTTIGDLFLDFQTSAQPTAFLPTDGSARVEGTIKPPSLLPEGLVAKVENVMDKLEGVDLKRLFDNLNELTAARTPEDVKAGKAPNLPSALGEFENAAAALQTLIRDPQSDFNRLLGDARTGAQELTRTLKRVDETLATVQTTVDTYSKAGQSLEKTSNKASDLVDLIAKDARVVGDAVENFNALVQSVRGGKGTIGQLVTSDELHRDLVDLVERLQKTTDNANRLITMWREEGVFAKEGK